MSRPFVCFPFWQNSTRPHIRARPRPPLNLGVYHKWRYRVRLVEVAFALAFCHSSSRWRLRAGILLIPSSHLKHDSGVVRSVSLACKA